MGSMILLLLFPGLFLLIGGNELDSMKEGE